MNKTLEVICRTFKQSTDANILLGAGLATTLFTDYDGWAVCFYILAAKQYLWGHLSRSSTKEFIKKSLENDREISRSAVMRYFGPGICCYSGAFHTLKEYEEGKLKIE